MKRILGIAVVFGLVGALTVLAQEVKPGKVDVIDLGKDVKLEMVLIPAGKFMRGTNITKPPHEVTLTKPFYMGKYEVTTEQWFEIMGENPSSYKDLKLPVTKVSWIDCQEFIKKLNEKTKGGYRLPTEAEWEYACRAGTTTAYSFGDKITPKDANYYDSKLGKPVAVGSYKPNAFGLYDMHGNVWEWCEDRHGTYPAGAVTDPKGPAIVSPDKNIIIRVLRGGSCNDYGSKTSSSFRYNGGSTIRSGIIGFRLAMTY